MTFKGFLLTMSMSTFFAWIGFLIILVNIDPLNSGGYGFLLFYTTLSIALLGTFSVFGTLIRAITNRQELVSRLLVKSMRHAVLLTILFIGSLVLLSRELFTIWTGGLFIMLLGLIEMVYLSAKGNRKAPVHKEG